MSSNALVAILCWLSSIGVDLMPASVEQDILIQESGWLAGECGRNGCRAVHDVDREQRMRRLASMAS